MPAILCRCCVSHHITTVRGTEGLGLKRVASCIRIASQAHVIEVMPCTPVLPSPVGTASVKYEMAMASYHAQRKEPMPYAYSTVQKGC